MRDNVHSEFLSKDILRDLQHWAHGAKACAVDEDCGLSVLVADLLRRGVDLNAGGYVHLVEEAI